MTGGEAKNECAANLGDKSQKGRGVKNIKCLRPNIGQIPQLLGMCKVKPVTLRLLIGGNGVVAEQDRGRVPGQDLLVVCAAVQFAGRGVERDPAQVVRRAVGAHQRN